MRDRCRQRRCWQPVVAAEPGAAPTGITVRSDPRAPVTVTVEGGRPRLVDPYTGAILGEPSPRLRAFFRTMTDWHRWIALQGTSRATGKAITGAANLGFLFIVLSGIYLWVPRVWSRLQFTQVLWFRGGLPGKARDFNWHNVIGIWSADPAGDRRRRRGADLLLRGPATWSTASPVRRRRRRRRRRAPPAPGRRSGPSGARRCARPSGERERGGRERAEPSRSSVTGLDAAWAAAQAQVPAWRTTSVRLGGPAQAPFVITLDEGYGGQPQYRRTLSVDRASAAIVKTRVVRRSRSRPAAAQLAALRPHRRDLRPARPDRRRARLRRRRRAGLHRHRARLAPLRGRGCAAAAPPSGVVKAREAA